MEPPSLHGQFGVLNAGFTSIWKCYFLNGTDTGVMAENLKSLEL